MKKATNIACCFLLNDFHSNSFPLSNAVFNNLYLLISPVRKSHKPTGVNAGANPQLFAEEENWKIEDTH